MRFEVVLESTRVGEGQGKLLQEAGQRVGRDRGSTSQWF